MSHYGPSSPNPGQPDPYQSGSYGWNPQGSPPQQPQAPQPGFAPYMPVAQPGTLPLRPLSLGDYFNSLFSILRKSPGLFFGAALIFGGLAAILTATGEFLLTRSLGSLAAVDPFAQFDQAMGGFAQWILVSVFLAQIATGFGYVFTWGIYSTMVGRGGIGMKTSLSQGFRLLRGQWGRLIGLTLIIFAGGIILVVAMMLLMLLMGFLVTDFTEPVSGGAVFGIIFVVFGSFLLPLVPALFFITRWCLVVPAMIVEDIGPFAAMRRSWRLTRGNFWRTFGIGVLFTVIVSIVQGVIMTPLLMFSSFALLGAGTEAELSIGAVLVNTIVTAISTLASFVIYNMVALVTNSLYYDYRFRKEGLHFELQQVAAQYSAVTTVDRFDTSPDQRPSTFDEGNLILPGRHSAGMQHAQPGSYPQSGPYSGPYGQQPPQPPQGPPQGPGPYR